MTYGDGCFLVTDDVVAHELTHGVTEKESGLIYAFQQGAINESFSDIWGEFVDQTNGKGTDTAAVKWLMGEDTSIGAIRNMKNPPAFKDPDRMGSPLYYTGSQDSCGVHSNSGVGNKAAYLITDGDTFNGYTNTGIGIAKAAAIYYEAQTNILTLTSNYHSLYDALNTACATLTGGADGITSADCVEVNKALLATEMNLLPLPPPIPANDDFSGATDFLTLPYTGSQDIITATSADDDPTFPASQCPYIAEGTNTVWYKFTPATSGYVTINMIGSEFDTVLGVWKGASPSALTSVGCNDDMDYNNGNYQSQLLFHVTAGQTYMVEVAGWYDVAQNFTLNASFAAPIKSDDAQDGWLLESSKNGTGGSKNSDAATFRLGDNSANRQYRSLLSFDTSDLAGTTITKVTLRMKIQGVVGGGNPVKMFKGFMADIKSGFFGTSALTPGDFQSPADHSYGAFKPMPIDNYWYEIPLTKGSAFINKTGTTQIRLRFSLEDNGNGIDNYLSLFSGNAASALNRPRLIIEYSVP